MNIFDQKLQESGQFPLKAAKFSVLEANITYKCNLRCTHCYVESSPDRTEMMSKDVMDKILDVLRNNSGINTVDITGGAPEMNPHYRYFVKACADLGKKVMVRSNLAIFSEPGMEDIPDFLAKNGVKIIASLPCFSEDGVDVQRGKGTYKKAIAALKRLNSLGYAQEGTGLEIDLVFNPGKPGLAPDRAMLEKVYKE
ncbi:MAG: radical SAM protein, partial [Nitrospirota bacterium]